MKNQSLILISCITILSLECFSQTTRLYGRVIDQNNRPLDYALVTLTSSKSSSKLLTDDNGIFMSSSVKADTIFVSATTFGYKQTDTILYLKYADSNWVELKLELKSQASDTINIWIGFGAERAKDDIKNNNIRILLPSGLVLRKLPGDENFEEKYRVKFYNQCQYVAEKSISEYNKVVFRYLDKTFGKQWRNEVRQDLIGLKK